MIIAQVSPSTVPANPSGLTGSSRGWPQETYVGWSVIHMIIEGILTRTPWCTRSQGVVAGPVQMTRGSSNERFSWSWGPTDGGAKCHHTRWSKTKTTKFTWGSLFIYFVWSFKFPGSTLHRYWLSPPPDRIRADSQYPHHHQGFARAGEGRRWKWGSSNDLSRWEKARHQGSEGTLHYHHAKIEGFRKFIVSGGSGEGMSVASTLASHVYILITLGAASLLQVYEVSSVGESNGTSRLSSQRLTQIISGR